VVQDDLHTSLIAVSPVEHDLPVVIDGVEVVDAVRVRNNDSCCKLLSKKGCGRKRKRGRRSYEVVGDNFSMLKRVVRARRG
jgi:hypothetical protein